MNKISLTNINHRPQKNAKAGAIIGTIALSLFALYFVFYCVVGRTRNNVIQASLDGYFLFAIVITFVAEGFFLKQVILCLRDDSRPQSSKLLFSIINAAIFLYTAIIGFSHFISILRILIEFRDVAAPSGSNAIQYISQIILQVVASYSFLKNNHFKDAGQIKKDNAIRMIFLVVFFIIVCIVFVVLSFITGKNNFYYDCIRVTYAVLLQSVATFLGLQLLVLCLDKENRARKDIILVSIFLALSIAWRFAVYQLPSGSWQNFDVWLIILSLFSNAIGMIYIIKNHLSKERRSYGK